MLLSLIKVVDPIISYKYKHPIIFYVALFAVIILVNVIYVYSTRFERTITVKEKHEYATGKYMRNTILDENSNAYQVSSSIPLLHFTDAETWLHLEKNNKYTISGYGWRVPILGMYPNIVTIK